MGYFAFAGLMIFCEVVSLLLAGVIGVAICTNKKVMKWINKMVMKGVNEIMAEDDD